MRSIVAARTFLIILIAALLACGGGKPSVNQAESSAPSSLPALFPSDSPTGEVVAAGEATLYNGRELYDLNNGGADLFNEFGFVEAAVREYKAEGGATIIANIYRMTDSQAAFGIFSVTRRISHRPASLGTIGARGDYQVLFCAGDYFVDVQATEGDTASVNAMNVIVTDIELQLEQESNQWPEVLSLLPRKGLIPHTETYVEGPLGINTRLYVSDTNLFELGDTNPGAMGAYRMRVNSNPASFLVVQYPDSAAAARVFDSVSEYYLDKAEKASGDSAKVNITEKRIVYTGPARMDVMVLRTTQITVLFDTPGAMHGTGADNPNSAVKAGKPVMPHGMSNPHGMSMPQSGGMTTGSGSKKPNN